MTQRFDISVIGGGPAGYVAAIRAAQLGKRVALIERERIGGTCMNWGCIPTKYLLHETRLYQALKHNSRLSGPAAEIGLNWTEVQAEKRRRVGRLITGIEFLLQKNGITVVTGTGTLGDDRRIEVRRQRKADDVAIENDHVILANGSRPAGLKFLRPDGDRVLTSREALDLERVPPTMLVVGGGAVGLEMGSLFQRAGCEVTVLEILPQILLGADLTLARRLERQLKSQGINIHTRMRIEGADKSRSGVELRGVNLKDGRSFSFSAHTVLMAAGRTAESEGCAHPDLNWNEDGFLQVNHRWATGLSGVYAIGDLVGGKLLAHKASHEGILAVENIAGAGHDRRELTIPSAVYTDPEYASVGLTEAEAKERLGDGIKTGVFSMQANGRALTMGETDGMVKVVADRNDRIVGGHILAPHASEWISELTLAVTRGLTLQDVGSAVHLHPTLSEAAMEAALHAEGRAVHALNL